MRVSIRWKLFSFIFIPTAAVTVLVCSLVLSEISPEQFRSLTEGACLSPDWAVVVLISLLSGLLLTTGLYFEKRVSAVSKALRRLGRGELGVRVKSSVAADEFGELSRVFNAAAGELELRFEELSRVNLAGQEVQGDLRAARKIQASLLPTKFPVDERYQLFGLNCPAEHVGGDFFDYFLTGDGEIVLVIADVSGKGIPAAIWMAVSRTIVRNLAMSGFGPAGILMESNRALVENQIGATYVTLFVAKYNPDNGEYTYANGAHLPGLYVSNEAVVTSVGEATGTLVGVFQDAEFTQGTGCLEKGELLLLYTDGVTEARSPMGEFYGDGPVRRLLSAYSDAPPHFLGGLIERSVNAFQGGEAADDLTLLMLRRLK